MPLPDRREGETHKDFPKRWMKGYLEVYAQENQSFVNAFADRNSNPQNWRAELAKAKEAFPEALKELPGNKVRSDVEAAKAAVSGTSTEPPDDDDDGPSAIELWQMTPSDFVRHTERLKAKAGR